MTLPDSIAVGRPYFALFKNPRKKFATPSTSSNCVTSAVSGRRLAILLMVGLCGWWRSH